MKQRGNILFAVVLGVLLVDSVMDRHNGEGDWWGEIWISMSAILGLMVGYRLRSSRLEDLEEADAGKLYISRVQRGPLIAFLVIFLMSTSITVEGDQKTTWLFRGIMLVLLLGSLFLKYTFKIDETQLIYEITFLGIKLYKRSIFPHEMNSILFVRKGWSKMGAVLKIKKGLNLHLIHFEPQKMYGELDCYATKHSIFIIKTNDFLILEKLLRNKSA